MQKARKKYRGLQFVFFTMIIYFGLVTVFYWLAGDDIQTRASRGNLELGVADAGSIELVKGTSVEQIFSVPIQSLETISVEWGTYNRPNKGMATVTLYNNETGEVLATESYDASKITERQVTTMVLSKPLTDIYNIPLKLSITADSVSGTALSPMTMMTAQKENFQLLYNGKPVDGLLNFAVTGTDKIWSGTHYWQIMSAFSLLVLVYAVYVWRCYIAQKRCLFLIFISACKRYNFLVKQLISRDFKNKYKRSILGVFWSFLNPLLTMIVQYVVFSNLFRFDIPNYQVYLLCGIVLFNFFSEACGMMVTSIIGNSSLIQKVYMPKYMFPLARTLSSMVNLLISLIPLFLVVLFSGIFPTKAYLLLSFDLACLMIFTLGVGMVLSTSMVFFRDTQFLWGVLSMIWMYLTPIFYPESILEESVLVAVKCNPLYYYVNFSRTVIMEGSSPEPMMYVQCLLFAAGSFLIGAIIFKKNQNKFVLYL